LLQPIPEIVRNSATDEPQHRKLLRDLVAMSTVTADRAANRSALNFIAKFLTERGMYVESFESDGLASLVATTRPEQKRPIVMLSGHVDVVPHSDGAYALSMKDGKYRGRGVMDMKFAVAAYMHLVDILKDDLARYDFGIMITSDEEIGGKNGTGMLVQQMGYRPAVAIVPDSGENWKIETFAKGVQWIKLEAKGTSGHASRPWEGDSAIKRLLTTLNDIDQLIPQDPKPLDTIISVGTIEGGTTANQIPHEASAMLDIRIGSMDDFNDLYPKISGICEAHGVHATLLVNDTPCINDPDNPLIKPFIDILSQQTGQKHGTSQSFAATDGRYFSAAGVPCIIIQPPAGGHHTDEEWLSVKGYDQFCTILEQYVRKIADTQDVTTDNTDVPQTKDQEYVWYATYGSGLSKDNFMCYIEGGTPEGISYRFPGCSDRTAPLRDVFLSIPFELYFAGESKIWGGGYMHIKTTPNSRAHTIARAYLITLEQFRDIIAQHNERQDLPELPLDDAIQKTHATIGKDLGSYEEIVYCGNRDGYPIFTITATKPVQPLVPPTDTYAKLLYKGLSEHGLTTVKDAVNYILTKPGAAGNFQEKALIKLFSESPKT